MSRPVTDKDQEVVKDQRPSDNYKKKSYRNDPKLKNLIRTEVTDSAMRKLREERPEVIVGFEFTNVRPDGKVKKDRITGALIPGKDGNIGVVLSREPLDVKKDTPIK